jgi:NADH-quinone oxidoreductase subunit F
MDVCTRAQTDEPINIPTIKRYAADTAREKGITVVFPKAPEKQERIAIIGGGPSGLSAAYYLCLMGYRPTILEQLPQLGGMLRYGIPAYRLPRDILDEEIEAIIHMGVAVKTGVTVGKDISFKEISETFDAVFIGSGAHTSQLLGIPGEKLEGVYGGAEFLRQVELGSAPPVGARVAVIGGGNVAIDVARTCRRMGAQVTILYRREKKDMPASVEEIDDALDEGIGLTTLMMPHSISVTNGKLALSVQHCEPGDYDSSGRRRPAPLPDMTTTESFDTIFAAIGQVTDTSFATDLDLDKGWIAVDRWTLATNLKRVYAGGDVITGPAMAVDAVAAGKRAAMAIDRELAAQRGERPTLLTYAAVPLSQEIPGEIVEQPMTRTPKLSPTERIGGFKEVDSGFDTDKVKAECARCLRCDLTVEEG